MAKSSEGPADPAITLRLLRIKERLEQLAGLDPHFQVFGAKTHEYRLEPPLVGPGIAEFEERYGIRLPEDYRAFLAHLGNGGAGPGYGMESLWDSTSLDLDVPNDEDLLDPSRPFPFSEAWNLKLEEAGGDVDFERRDREYFDPAFSNGVIRLSNYGCAIWINLVVNGAARGTVWVDDRASDGGIHPYDGDAPGERMDFLTWYERWLDKSLEQLVMTRSSETAHGQEKQTVRRMRIILLHAGAFVLLSVTFVVGASEHLLDLLLPDFHQVEHWMVLVVSGVLVIGAGCCVSMWIRLRRSKGRSTT